MDTAFVAPLPRPGLAGLHPGNFALVMATGILSLGFGLLGHASLANALFAIGLAAWMKVRAPGDTMVYRLQRRMPLPDYERQFGKLP